MKKFDNRYKIKRHVSIHAKDFIRWPCFRCGKTYSTDRGLTDHKCEGKSNEKKIHKNPPIIDVIYYDNHWHGTVPT